MAEKGKNADLGIRTVNALVAADILRVSTYESKSGKSYIKVSDVIGGTETYYRADESKNVVLFASDGEPMSYIVDPSREGKVKGSIAMVVGTWEEAGPKIDMLSKFIEDFYDDLKGHNPNRGIVDFGTSQEPPYEIMRFTIRFPPEMNPFNLMPLLDKIEEAFVKPAVPLRSSLRNKEISYEDTL